MAEKPLLPPWLRKGDTIGLFCPSGPVRDIRQVEAGIKVITDMGFKVKVKITDDQGEEYLAGADEVRANHLHTLWADDQIKALWAIRGGFGCLRLVSYLDIELIKRSPKLLIGFSDLTVLSTALLKKANMVTFHGPVISTLATTDEESIGTLFACVTGNFPEYLQARSIDILRQGNAGGQLIGGNLTTLVHLLGTEWDLPWDNCILAIEDTGETMYRLDRMLTQLALSGRFERLAGLLIGSFDTGNKDTLATLRLQEQVWMRILELTKGYSYPIWAGFPFGHLRQNQCLPIGMDVTLNSNKGTLELHPDSVQMQQ